MGFRYVLVLNVLASTADAINYQTLDTNVRNACAIAGFGVEGPHCSKHSVDGGFFARRSLISVSLNIVGTDYLTADRTRALDAAVVSAIKSTARVGWSVNGIVGGLPSQGNGSYRVSILPTNDVTEVQRETASGDGIPRVTITNPVATTTVQETTDPSIVPGTRTPSAARDLTEQAKGWASENKPIIYGALAVVGIASIAIIVVKVK